MSSSGGAGGEDNSRMLHRITSESVWNQVFTWCSCVMTRRRERDF